jgi:DNA modification methylase
VQILRGNALALALADESVDLIVTSPPYFGLRSYQDGGEHYAGQIGDEPTPAEFVDALIAATAEMVRVLKPSGSIWVNLGDKYASGGRTSYDRTDINGERGGASRPQDGARPKSLLGIPWRYAIRCIDDLGLILRANVIWSKPNGLPESVTDRVRRSHEDWFHFTLSPRYFSAVDEIREAHVGGSTGLAATFARPKPSHDLVPGQGFTQHRADRDNVPAANPLGKLPSSVWEIEHDSENVVRHVLSAISTGSLTIEEGERILTGVRQWTGSNGSGARSTRAVNAGSGLAASPLPDTANSGSTDAASSGTESPTHSLTEPYPRVVCNSTTYAEPGHVCDLNISSPSASATTSCADPRPSQPSTPPRPTAETATSSATSTPTDRQTEAACAESACEPRTDAPTGERRAAPQPDVPGSVWTIPTEPLHVPDHLGIDHFAAFPTEWPRRIIQGWSPRGICVECGEGRRPTSERDPIDPRFLASNKRGDGRGNVEVRGVSQSSILRTGLQAGQSPATRITGEACACPEPTAPTRPAVVLDPFGGTGTTALVAKALGRHGISNDMSADYCRLAGWRTTDPKQLAKAARRPFVPPAEQTEGQLDLLEGIA